MAIFPMHDWHDIQWGLPSDPNQGDYLCMYRYGSLIWYDVVAFSPNHGFLKAKTPSHVISHWKKIYPPEIDGVPEEELQESLRLAGDRLATDDELRDLGLL